MYSLFNNLGNYSTPIVKGENPFFSYMRAHPIPESSKISSTLDSLEIEFIIFDDSMDINNLHNGEDVIGSYNLNLGVLREKEVIDEAVEIRDPMTGRRIIFKIGCYFMNSLTGVAGDMGTQGI